MTHDELLNKLRDDNWDSYEPYISALRAVVELHEAYESESFGVMRQWCTECSTEDYDMHYPCPTIRAIEKELG
jgi:hypothetical protein